MAQVAGQLAAIALATPGDRTRTLQLLYAARFIAPQNAPVRQEIDQRLQQLGR
ncbi:MAG: hypothetical protein LDL56_03280 [Armatimonadetes bacterium]|nr:hypothetical protein [Armatimonadota bacterium]